MFAATEPVGAVCHAPGALRYVKTPDGALLVREKKVSGFSNSTE
jgi:putative intracellular protease/amidase